VDRAQRQRVTSSSFRWRSVPPLPCVVFVVACRIRYFFCRRCRRVFVYRHVFRRRSPLISSSPCVFVVDSSHLFVVAVTFRPCIIIVSPCTFIIVASRFSFVALFNLLFCLSVMDSFSFFFVGLSVCQLRDSCRDISYVIAAA
jgi:hypothetical protein